MGSNSRSADSTRYYCRQSWPGRGFDSFPWVRKLCKNWKNGLKRGQPGKKCLDLLAMGSYRRFGGREGIILGERLTQSNSHHSRFPVGIWSSDPRTHGPPCFSSYPSPPKTGLEDLLFMLQRLWGVQQHQCLHKLQSNPRMAAIHPR